MSLLISSQSLGKAFGSRQLFSDLSISVFSKNRIGLIGPNGAGKSTLLKIIAGLEKADSGTLSYKKELQVGYVPQACTFPEISPEQVLMDAISVHLPHYEKERLAKMWLSKLKFKDEHISAHILSGGWKKRLSFAKALITEPDILLLDEPTNHLDLEGIFWLEQFLLREAVTFIVVSHDRYFLQNVTNRIVELDKVYPKGLFSIEGSYHFFLEKKGEFLEGQLSQQRSLASKARKEKEWLQSNPKARTTKARSRIDLAEEVLGDLSEIKKRNKQHISKIHFEATERETRKLIVVNNLSKKAGERTLFRNLNFSLTAGLRIGLMGPNGAGKTTLLRLLAGECEPDQGTIKRAEGLKIVYFDQHRSALPDHTTLRDALSPTGDFVSFQGQKIHVNGWCQRFLFSPDILDMPISRLSGGERARISIAHLMLQPADVLLLDEPTNDLDIPTLEVFENSLSDFSGAVVLITHDRYMLNRICRSLLALGDPERTIFYADYAQWEASQIVEKTPKTKIKPELKKNSLSSKEKQEYQKIEGEIQKLEKMIHELNQLLEDPQISQNPQKLQEICSAVGMAENQIEQLYVRWYELDHIVSNRFSALDEPVNLA